MDDVLIVGAGPAGSSTALTLAGRGYRVKVMEEHSRVGDPENCAGLIGSDLFDTYDLPNETVVREFSSASFYSPGRERASVEFHRPMARVVRRGDFDRAMARKAESAGAVYLTGTRCLDLTPRSERVEVLVESADEDLKKGTCVLEARAVVLATGVRRGLHDRVGLSGPGRYMESAHTVVRMRDVFEIEVFVGRQLAPGYFAWVLPLEEDHVRIGICSERRAVEHLRRFFHHPLVAGRMIANGSAIRAKRIPTAPVEKSYASRILIVGDAAGQVKPTTGGGIGCSIICGNIAGEVLARALEEDDLSEVSMSEYEEAWHGVMIPEFDVSSYFRRFFATLSDKSLDLLIGLLGRTDVRGLIERYGDFDRHGGLLRRLAKIREVGSLLSF